MFGFFKKLHQFFRGSVNTPTVYISYLVDLLQTSGKNEFTTSTSLQIIGQNFLDQCVAIYETKNANSLYNAFCLNILLSSTGSIGLLHLSVSCLLASYSFDVPDLNSAK